VHITGELDLAAGDGVTHAVVDAVAVALTRPAGEAEVQLDLSEVSFIDCAGLSALLRARRSAAAHGFRVRVVAMSPAVHRLFDLSDTLALLAPPGLPDPA
jgi:anti-sigma B factor antagonist